MASHLDTLYRGIRQDYAWPRLDPWSIVDVPIARVEGEIKRPDRLAYRELTSQQQGLAVRIPIR